MVRYKKYNHRNHGRHKQGKPLGRWFLILAIALGCWVFFKPSTPEQVVIPQSSATLSSSSLSLSSSKVIAAPKAKVSSKFVMQKDTVLAARMKVYLERYKPKHALYLMVDGKNNEILAWGQFNDSTYQSKPSYLVRSDFPAASLIKTVTAAAALESGKYSPRTQIPQIGNPHKLYKKQIKVPKNYKGPRASLLKSYAKSYNPAMAIIGNHLGASYLDKIGRRLGFDRHFALKTPERSNFSPPDSGYALAEAASGFNQSSTLSPLHSAGIISSILQGKAYETPWSPLLAPVYAPKQALNLGIKPLKQQTYKDMRKLLEATFTIGTARNSLKKEIFKQYRKKLVIGGKTGTLDGTQAGLIKGRYQWFSGYAHEKGNRNNSVIIVVLQIHNKSWTLQSTAISGLLINDWAKGHLK